MLQKLSFHPAINADLNSLKRAVQKLNLAQRASQIKFFMT